MKKVKQVPKFKSIEEEAEFWDTHSTEDFPDYWEPVTDIKFSKNLVSVYEGKAPINFDKETVEAINKIAKKKGVGTSTAARMLIRERLSELNVL